MFLLISRSSFVSSRTWYIMCLVKNPSSLKLFKLKVKCWCCTEWISWRWPWLMRNMTWGKWISTQCGEIICEMLPLYESCARASVRTVHLSFCVRACACTPQSSGRNHQENRHCSRTQSRAAKYYPLLNEPTIRILHVQKWCRNSDFSHSTAVGGLVMEAAHHCLFAM